MTAPGSCRPLSLQVNPAPARGMAAMLGTTPSCCAAAAAVRATTAGAPAQQHMDASKPEAPTPAAAAKGSGARWASALKSAQQVVQENQQAAADAAADVGRGVSSSRDTATIAHTKLAVFVRGARNLAADHGGRSNLYAKVYCLGKSGKTECTMNDRDPRWDQVVILEVDTEQLPHATLDVQVKQYWRVPLARGTLGCLRLPLADVAQFQEPAWLPLSHSLGGSSPNGAEIELQIFASKERLKGSLNVLCATWNVGNEQPPPPQDLLQWLVGCDRQEHHLVVVSAQECNYVRSARRSSSARRTASPVGPQELAQAYSLSPADIMLAEDMAAQHECKDQAADQQQSSMEGDVGSGQGPQAASALASTTGCTPPLPQAAALPTPFMNLQTAPSGPTAHALAKQDALSQTPGSNLHPHSPLTSFESNTSTLSSSKPSPMQHVPSKQGSMHTHSSIATQGSLQSVGSSNRSLRHRNVLMAQAKRVKDSYDSAAAWEQHIGEALGPRYWLLSSRHMFQTRLLLFARQDVVAAVRNIRTGYEATGIGRVGMNKGGVAIALQLGDTKLAFVGAHLAAHQSKVLTRNADVAEIVTNMPSLGDTRGGDLLTGFHHVFWMGDLNYRVDFGAQAQIQDDSPCPADFDAMLDHIQRQSYAKLLAGDQLLREVAAGRVLLGFKEAPISFAPTFKVTKGHTSHAYNPKRSPAWCDRVLWRSNLPHKQAQPLLYTSAPGVATSDHKPVAATFSVPTVEHTAAGKRPHHRTAPSSKLCIESLELTNHAAWRACLGPLVGAGSGKVKLELRAAGSILMSRKDQVLQVDASTLSSAEAATAEPLPLARHAWVLPLLRPSTGTLTGINDDTLLLRLVAVEGWGLGFMRRERVLARGVLPLQPAVAEYRQWLLAPPGSTRGLAEVQVDMESGSVHAGTIVARLQLVSKGADRIAAGFLQHIISAKHKGQALVAQAADTSTTQLDQQQQPTSLPPQQQQQQSLPSVTEG